MPLELLAARTAFLATTWKRVFMIAVVNEARGAVLRVSVDWEAGGTGLDILRPQRPDSSARSGSHGTGLPHTGTMLGSWPWAFHSTHGLPICQHGLVLLPPLICKDPRTRTGFALSAGSWCSRRGVWASEHGVLEKTQWGLGDFVAFSRRKARIIFAELAAGQTAESTTAQGGAACRRSSCICN